MFRVAFALLFVAVASGASLRGEPDARKWVKPTQVKRGDLSCPTCSNLQKSATPAMAKASVEGVMSPDEGAAKDKAAKVDDRSRSKIEEAHGANGEDPVVGKAGKKAAKKEEEQGEQGEKEEKQGEKE